VSGLTFGLLISACTLQSVGQGAPDSTEVLALVGARIYASPGATPISAGVVLVQGGLIRAIGTRQAVPIPAGAKLLDCSGTTIVAGFWNSHVHFTEPHWERADTLPAAVLTEQLRAMLTRYGFVRVLDTGSLLANTLALRRRVGEGEVIGPEILTTGSGFVPEHASPFDILPDSLPELRSAEEARAKVASRLREGADAIKLFTGSSASPTTLVPMPLAIVRAAAAEAHRYKKLVLAHPGNTAGLEAALEGGVDILAHTSPEGGLWPARRLEQMKQARLGLIPTLKLWVFELRRRGADSLSIERFRGIAIAQLRSYLERGGEILFGTDVGYMTDYDPTDEYLYMEQAGMSFQQILAALTTSPASRFGISGRVTGRLEVGKEADLVILDGHPERDVRALAQVRGVLRRGRAIFAR